MNIFRQLRWKLTLSYTLVTVGAFLVILLIMAGLVLTQIFVPQASLNPEELITWYMNDRTNGFSSNYLLWSEILDQSPVDTELVRLYIRDSKSFISGSDLFRIGAVQFSASTMASIRVLIIGADGKLLGTSDLDNSIYRSSIGIEIGKPFDPTQVPGLEGPFKAALAGDTDPKHLYTTLEPDQRYVFAAPLFSRSSGDPRQVVGVIVVIFEAIPTQADVPAHILKIAGRSLLIFLLGAGIMGAVFGAIFANGLTTRFKRISDTTDLWSLGDFTRHIDDSVGDEITQLGQRLNRMAEQLKILLRRRQEMAVSEERNRLARDLHDSAKQQALAASLELGTALTLFERDPQGAKTHLVEADALVDAVRKELTNLVHELRPQDMDGQDFSETLREYALEWSQRNEIELDFNVEGRNEIPLETRDTLFRIAQEALANVARHSAASQAEVCLEFKTNTVTLSVKDNGRGFAPEAPHSGVGLASMRERAEGLGGSLTIESAPGQGAQIVVSLSIADEGFEEAR
jgi:NarL family two-component system sensor histidine kinase LiaS